MKSVKEIKDFMDKYRYMAITPQNTQQVNQFVFDTLIAITERLEAQEKPFPCDTCEMVISPNQREDIRRVARRDGMIAALRWVCAEYALSIPAQFEIAEAITRLENGGDL